MKVDVKSLDEAAREEYNYLRKIKTGEIVPTTSGFRFIDKSLIGGFNTGDICTIAALSGVGKTTLAIKVGYNVATLNKNVRTLLFSFEIQSRKIASKLITDLKKTTMEKLYSKTSAIDKKDFEIFKNIPFDIIDSPLNIKYISEAIDKYSNRYPNDRIHCIIDHTLLVDNFAGDSDMGTLIELANMCNKLKKQYNVVFILVSQLNDTILKPERIRNKYTHYPGQSDIFGSKAIVHVSDFVTCGVNPTRLNLPRGTNGQSQYGNFNLPLNIKMKDFNKTMELLYWHNIKVRFGKLSITPLINRLEHSVLEELSPATYDKFVEKYKIQV